jgi:predicted TPR repeat methyltransferase
MEDFYPEPDEALKKRRFIEYKSRFIEPLFPKDKSVRILDMGCGYGLFLDACKRLGYTNLLGVELISKFADYAKREFGLDNIATRDLFSFLESKDDNYFDIITAFNIVEHVKKEKVEYLLNLINKKLKPEGMFVMEVPNADSPLGIHTFFTDITHEFAFSRKLAVKLLHLAGFDSIRVRYQPMRRNPLIILGRKILAKLLGSEYPLMFSGNIILAGYKKEV